MYTDHNSNAIEQSFHCQSLCECCGKLKQLSFIELRAHTHHDIVHMRSILICYKCAVYYSTSIMKIYEIVALSKRERERERERERDSDSISRVYVCVCTHASVCVEERDFYSYFL